MSKLHAEAFIRQMEKLPKDHGINAAVCSPEAYKTLEEQIHEVHGKDRDVEDHLHITFFTFDGLEPDDVLMFGDIKGARELVRALKESKRVGLDFKPLVQAVKKKFIERVSNNGRR